MIRTGKVLQQNAYDPQQVELLLIICQNQSQGQEGKTSLLSGLSAETNKQLGEIYLPPLASRRPDAACIALSLWTETNREKNVSVPYSMTLDQWIFTSRLRDNIPGIKRMVRQVHYRAMSHLDIPSDLDLLLDSTHIPVSKQERTGPFQRLLAFFRDRGQLKLVSSGQAANWQILALPVHPVRSPQR